MLRGGATTQASGATISDAQGVGTMVNDDAAFARGTGLR